MHAGHRRHRARGAEQVRALAGHALAQPVLGLERRAAWPATSATMASNIACVDEPAAVALGERDDAHGQRRPGGDAVLHLQPVDTVAFANLRLYASRSSQISSDEPPPMSNTRAKSQLAIDRARRSRTRPAVASVSRLTTWMSRSVSRADAARGTAARCRPAGRPRWRSGRTRATLWCRILAAQTLSASMVRSMASCDSRRLAATPSPRRMMRENASMTLKPRGDGRATSSRQLLVPRSRAA